MKSPSNTHLIVIPSYNSGPLLKGTVKGALAMWNPVWVVVDGSTDGSDRVLADLQAEHPGLNVLRHEKNSGKGSAMLTAALAAREAGFTHMLAMDSDGQHRVNDIPALMRMSEEHPEAMVLGKPVFDTSAPKARVLGRKISNLWTHIETLWGGIGDSLFGFRVYPIGPLISAMQSTRWARRFDFDPEVVVRMSWKGVPAVNLASPVRYPSKEEGGVSQFRYLRDNTLLSWMHVRLFGGAVVRFPRSLYRRIARRPPYGPGKKPRGDK